MAGLGIKDNSNLEEFFKEENSCSKYDKCRYQGISEEDKERLALAIKNMHDKLGDDKFNLVVETVMIATKNKDIRGEKMESKDIEEVLRKAIEMVNEI